MNLIDNPTIASRTKKVAQPLTGIRPLSFCRTCRFKTVYTIRKLSPFLARLRALVDGIAIAFLIFVVIKTESEWRDE
jgi:hypothetical protein